MSVTAPSSYYMNQPCDIKFEHGKRLVSSKRASHFSFVSGNTKLREKIVILPKNKMTDLGRLASDGGLLLNAFLRNYLHFV